MALPSPDQYNDAIQNPRLAFEDRDLRDATVECNGFGIPKALGGGFAITYRLKANNGKSFAVRCFHKEAPDLQERYRQIHAVLSKNSTPLFVSFAYQQDGIKVLNKRHPIVKMDWAAGVTLGEYIEQNHKITSVVQKLRESFKHLERDLHERGIAHGDLQNGNVLVSSNGNLQLVDYDGMYVPGMRVGGGAELGHKHFQHPQRNADSFGPTVDRFSFLVIDLSLWALSLQPDLYRQFSSGENIIFSANDFATPASSRVFSALRAIADAQFKKAIADFEAVCASPITAVPRLPDFMGGRCIPTSPSPRVTTRIVPDAYIGAFPVVDASSFQQVCKYVGDRVELVGKVVEIKEGKTRRRAPYVFVNFGNWRDDCARVTIWSEGLAAINNTGYSSWKGKWIAVNGMIDPVYHGKNRYKTISYRSVGITLSQPSQLRVITDEEASWRLGRGPCPKNPSPPQSQGVAANNVAILKGMDTSLSGDAPTGWGGVFDTGPPGGGLDPVIDYADGTNVEPIPTTPKTAQQRNAELLTHLGNSTSPLASREGRGNSNPQKSAASTKPAQSGGCLSVIFVATALLLLWGALPGKRPASRNAAPLATSAITSEIHSAGLSLWLNTSSGVRHNASCEHFRNTHAGRVCTATEGRPCGICGG